MTRGDVQLVFIGGIHGTGKSRLCAELAPAIRATCYAASDLLAETPTKAEKGVSNIDRNQQIILHAVKELRRTTVRLLLDGHFCLVTTAGEILKIPLQYFKALEPTALVLLETSDSEIQQRLKQRDDRVYSPELIGAMLHCERSHALAVSEALMVPLKVISGPKSLSETLAFLRSLL